MGLSAGYAALIVPWITTPWAHLLGFDWLFVCFAFISSFAWKKCLEFRMLLASCLALALSIHPSHGWHLLSSSIHSWMPDHNPLDPTFVSAPLDDGPQERDNWTGTSRARQGEVQMK